MAGFRRLYGASPWHLAAHVGAFFVAGWAIDQIVGGGAVVNWIAWFVGAVLLHDLVLLPLYSLVGGGIARVTRDRRGDGGGRGWVNHVRVPAIVAGILLLVYFPLILGLSAHTYRTDTGHALAGYTRNWLLVCAGLFLASALVWAVRRARGRADDRARP